MTAIAMATAAPRWRMLAGRSVDDVTRASLILDDQMASSRYRNWWPSPVGQAARVRDVSNPAPGRSRDRLLEAVIEGLLTWESGGRRRRVRAAARLAAGHAAGMPDLSRFGVRVAGAATVAVCLLPARGHLARLPAGRRGRLVAGLGRFPLVGEYVRLARGVGRYFSYYDVVVAS